MNKDTLVASVLGFSLGLIAAIALWVVPRIMPKGLPAPFSKPAAPASPVLEKQNMSLDISLPKDGEIVKTEKITVSGKVEKSEFLIISSASDSQTVKADSSGSFSTSLTLAQGGNSISITSYDTNKNAHTKSITVYVFDESK